ncbi:MAG: DeoR/GlpR family DNA-binding transcription regulator [Clostridium sp.]|nr:DeoR/GlpR family DNA-binding transcription regulator [Clostridium sp.]
MFIEERHKYILDCLDRDGKILVKDLSNKFNLSESMIRKDLQVLEKQNLLKRTYGGAIKVKRKLMKEISYVNRMENDLEIKEVVAKKAFDMINDNDTIFLDASSISYSIAKLISMENKSLTVITNMIIISSVLENSENVNLIFIGGDYSSIAGGCIGSHSIEQIKNYHCNKAFVGCVGINLEDGTLSTTLSEDANTKKAIMNTSKERYLLILNERFIIDGTYNFATINEFDSIISEAEPNKSILEELMKYDVHII